ncbi:MAG: DUF488 domain-containing protein [Planctomycetia bacterium]|jgi:uncharacterized protein (DUF488 family)|nr:DUF488 domain-containing protein [Planctomycetia bacterium]OQZ05709.1 MAG: hypothetical protein B6D36_08780 [Planctomycetes bacterium UTPLA1]
MIENATKPCLFTIGHSDHEMPAFVSLLAQHGVTAIADVRSQPYSRFHGQFNRETLAELLNRAGTQYVFLGQELGARRSERECYHEKQARYDLIAKLPAFREGLDRLRRGLTTHRIALLCAEKDPITCHRAVLVCRHLRADSIDIRHILEDGSVETMDQIESRLLEAVKVPTEHLFRSRSELIELAYDLQGERIAFRESGAPPVTSGAIR